MRYSYSHLQDENPLKSLYESYDTLISTILNFIVDEISGSSVASMMSVDDRESTKLVLEVVAVAENNGLKLPREFGLLLKQVINSKNLIAT